MCSHPVCPDWNLDTWLCVWTLDEIPWYNCWLLGEVRGDPRVFGDHRNMEDDRDGVNNVLFLSTQKLNHSLLPRSWVDFVNLVWTCSTFLFFLPPTPLTIFSRIITHSLTFISYGSWFYIYINSHPHRQHLWHNFNHQTMLIHTKPMYLC